MLYHISSQHCSQYKSLLVDRHCQGNDETKVNKGEQWEHLVRIMLEMMIAMMMMIVVMMIVMMMIVVMIAMMMIVMIIRKKIEGL